MGWSGAGWWCGSAGAAKVSSKSVPTSPGWVSWLVTLSPANFSQLADGNSPSVSVSSL